MSRVRVGTLRADAVFLGVSGVFGVIADVSSYLSGQGPFGPTFYGDPLVIGVVEAHALAILTATTLWYSARGTMATFGRWTALAAHLVLGVSNVVWFDVFTGLNADTQGQAVTTLHFVFCALHLQWIVRPTPSSETARGEVYQA